MLRLWQWLNQISIPKSGVWKLKLSPVSQQLDEPGAWLSFMPRLVASLLCFCCCDEGAWGA